jgi:hypothetical protein
MTEGAPVGWRAEQVARTILDELAKWRGAVGAAVFGAEMMDDAIVVPLFSAAELKHNSIAVFTADFRGAVEVSGALAPT